METEPDGEQVTRQTVENQNETETKHDETQDQSLMDEEQDEEQKHKATSEREETVKKTEELEKLKNENLQTTQPSVTMNRDLDSVDSLIDQFTSLTIN